MIVADTNLVVYLVLRGEHTADAEAVRAKDREWLVPPSLFRHELLNVLATYVRARQLDRDEALRMFRRGLALVRSADVEPDAAGVLNLAVRGGCSGYDAQFVWLASQRAIPLVTTDERLTDAFPEYAMTPGQFTGSDRT